MSLYGCPLALGSWLISEHHHFKHEVAIVAPIDARSLTLSGEARAMATEGASTILLSSLDRVAFFGIGFLR